MNRTAGIQISINFLVVMMISIVIIGLGLVLINRMVGSGGDQISSMDDRLRTQIEDLLVRENRLVAIPIVEKEFDRGTGDFFGIGVMNLQLQTVNFSVNVTFDRAFHRITGNDITDLADAILPSPSNWVLLFDGVKDIRARDKYVFTVGFQVPRTALPGLYIYNVSVTNSTTTPASDCIDNHLNCYDGSIHKLYVKVR